MPPRRSRRKASSDEAAEQSISTAKRAKIDQVELEENSTSRCQTKWQWETDELEWKAFSDDDNKMLTEGFVNGEDSVEIVLNRKVTFYVDMKEMYQRNKKTGWTRNIRCAAADGTCSEDWEWQDENADWVPYSSQIARRLEGGRVCGLEGVPFSCAGRDYTLKIDEMKQLNNETKTERDVRRNKPGSHPVWQWQDENKAWQPYAPSVCRKLEASFLSDQSSDVKVTAAGQSYTIHLSLMEQENDKTGVVRKVWKKGWRGPAPSHVTSKRVKSGKSAAKKQKPKREDEEDDDITVKSVQFQGKAPLDPLCTSKQGKAHVYFDGTNVWDAMLNQTNLQNNNNKYYIIQLLEENSKRQYSVWMRWGRVGFSGQSKLDEFGSDVDQAKQSFEKKFYDKTKNDWSNRQSFVKHPRKYDLLKMDYIPKEDEDKDEDEMDGLTESSLVGDTKPKPKPKSQLDERVQQLIELICNVQAMEDTVVEMKYDAKKAPLGKLTKDQIKAGYAALKKVESCIASNHYGDRLLRACDEFYTRIPHAFGMSRPPMIKTEEQVKAKMALLEALDDIEIAMRVINEKGSEDENPIDRHYAALKCQLLPLGKEIEEYKLVERYVKTTHAKTHNQYSLDVLDVFSVDKKCPYTDLGNRMLLWHGSRLSNWVGILSEGLRIAPPEAPVTGYMFGKGVYFADICSKSANYCFTTQSKNVGLLLLCDVSLGTPNDLVAADYTADQLPRGKQSVKGKGRIAPDPKHSHEMSDGCVVPLGPTTDTGIHNPTGYTLNYNEYVVYDVKQIKMRYLVKLKFDFK